PVLRISYIDRPVDAAIWQGPAAAQVRPRSCYLLDRSPASRPGARVIRQTALELFSEHVFLFGTRGFHASSEKILAVAHHHCNGDLGWIGCADAGEHIGTVHLYPIRG